MFTGLVEEVGQVEAITPQGDGRRLVIAGRKVSEGLRIGDSVAINGVCLTATFTAPGRFAVAAVAESLQRTTLGRLTAGTSVNLERAMLPTTRFGGHIVQGHVDGVGEVTSLQQRDPGFWLELRLPGPLLPLMVEKGSIAVDGVSLTIAALTGERIAIALIPHSAQQTTLAACRPGDRVNIECDIIGKYVQRLLEYRQGSTTLSDAKLEEWGY